MAYTPEGNFKKSFCSKLKKLGCTVLQYQQGLATVKGFPDTIILLPEGLTVFIEFKASKRSKFQPGQKEWNQKLLDRSYFAWICYPENANEIMEKIKSLL